MTRIHPSKPTEARNSTSAQIRFFATTKLAADAASHYVPPGLNPETRIHDAVYRNDCAALKLFLDNGADPNEAGGLNIDRKYSEKATPLQWAATQGHLEALELLLDAPGINITDSTDSGGSPLLQAVSGQHGSIVRRLLTLDVYRNSDGKGHRWWEEDCQHDPHHSSTPLLHELCTGRGGEDWCSMRRGTIRTIRTSRCLG